MRERTGPVGRIDTGGRRNVTGPIPSPVRNPLEALIPKPPKAPGAGGGSLGLGFKWATVTMAYPDPVQVQVDTESDPLPGVPSMLCQVSLDDRVLLLQVGRRVIVLGVAQPDQSQNVANDSGVVLVTPTAANTPTSVAVVFDVPFNQVPAITVTARTGVPQNVAVSYQDPATTGFTLWMTRTDTTATSVSWTAQV